MRRIIKASIASRVKSILNRCRQSARPKNYSISMVGPWWTSIGSNDGSTHICTSYINKVSYYYCVSFMCNVKPSLSWKSEPLYRHGRMNPSNNVVHGCGCCFIKNFAHPAPATHPLLWSPDTTMQVTDSEQKLYKMATSLQVHYVYTR